MGKSNIQNAIEKRGLLKTALLLLSLLLAIGGGACEKADAATYPILHNSSTANSKNYWGGKWGVNGGKYGQFTCATCHNRTTSNIKRIKENITAPDSSTWGTSGKTSMAVTFTNITGQNSFGDDTTAAGGAYNSSARICEVCHSKTVAHRYNNNTTVVTQKPNHQNASRTDCTSCHPHSAGFKPAGGGCTGCHGNPPTTTATLVTSPDATLTLGNPPTQAGAHDKHANQRGMQCNTCHNTFVMPAYDKKLQIGFDVKPGNWSQFAGTATYGNYSARSPLGGAPAYTWQGTSGTVVTTTASYRNSCNVYCHGGWSGSGASKRFSWTDAAGSATCGTCHGASAATTPQRGSHVKHASNGTTAYAISCTTCHPSRATGDIAHITGSVQWRLSTGSVKVPVGATYNSATVGATGAIAPSASYQSCNGIYCHSYKANDARTNKLVQWGTTLAADCTGCHPNDASATTKMSADAHKAHINNASARFSGMKFKCNECHANTVNSTDNRTLVSGAYGASGTHVNGTATVAWGTINAGSPNYVAASTCGSTGQTTYCHSDGAGGLPNYAPTAWNGVADSAEGNATCDYCHDGLAGDTYPASSVKHTAHIRTSGFTVPHAVLKCSMCHARTARANDTVFTSSTSQHINKVKNVRFNPVWGSVFTNHTGTYVGTTCDNTHCHGNVDQAWSAAGGAKTCGNANACHGATNGSVLSVPHNKHYNSGTAPATASAWNNQNNSTGTTNIFYCGTCHNVNNLTSHVNGPQQAGYGDAEVALSLLWGGGGDTAAKANTNVTDDSRKFTYSADTTCAVYCHSNGRGKKRSPKWTTGSVVCGDCHAKGNVFYDWSSAHNKHLNTYKLGGSSINCYNCHSTTVNSTSTSIANVANHPNGTKTVASSTFATFTWTAATRRCSAGYCHSAGVDFTSPFTNTTSLSWAGKTTNCGSCHGASSTNPEPNYTSGSPKANSHPKHASGLNYQCVTCHSRVVDALRNISSHALHVNQVYNVNAGGGYSFTLGNTPSPTTAASCTNISCHNNGSATWGGAARKCTDCHGTTGAEVINYVQDGTGALINTTEWGYSGHGKTTGTYDVTATAAANFPGAAGTGDPCEYCHDRTLNHYATGSNKLRLRNWSSATYKRGNGVCLSCHATGATGVDPDGAATVYANKTATKKIDKYHMGSQHSATLSGGRFCWDCHDGHGDRINSTTGPIVMVQLNPADASNSTTGIPTTTTSTAVAFTAKSAGSDFGKTASPYNGVCNVCHTYKAADPNKMVHYTKTSSDSHNSATLCTGCHKHSPDTTFDANAYKGQADCDTCHNGVPTGSGTQYVTRNVVGTDFAYASRHVYGGTVTKWDCIVCHREGDPATGQPSGLHDTTSTGKTVKLRNVDNITTGWTWNKTAVTNAMLTDMDNFCLACHDADGAAGINVNATNTGVNQNNTRALKPFNTTDGLGTGGKAGSYELAGYYKTRVLDVKTQFATTNPAHHAVLGKAYTSSPSANWPSTAWISRVLKNGNQLQTVRETAQLHCADCHTVDQNAHGGANTGMLQATSVDATCYLCHNTAVYNPSSATAETQSRFDHKTNDGSNTGSVLTTPYNSACRTCHGGDPEVDGYGGIHGLAGNDARNSQPRYRFIGGVYMAAYPGSWTGTTGATPTCYFQTNSKTQPFSTCGQHNSNQTGRITLPNYSRGTPGQY